MTFSLKTLRHCEDYSKDELWQKGHYGPSVTFRLKSGKWMNNELLTSLGQRDDYDLFEVVGANRILVVCVNEDLFYTGIEVFDMDYFAHCGKLHKEGDPEGKGDDRPVLECGNDMQAFYQGIRGRRIQTYARQMYAQFAY